jgi:hypothetical protein
VRVTVCACMQVGVYVCVHARVLFVCACMHVCVCALMHVQTIKIILALDMYCEILWYWWY